MLSSMYRWIVSVILSLRQFSGTRATPGRVVKRWDRVVTILGKGRLSWLVELVVWGQNTGSATRTGDSHLCLLDVLFTLFSSTNIVDRVRRCRFALFMVSFNACIFAI